VKVSFTDFGGFIPIARGCVVDTKDLASEQAAELDFLVQKSRIFELQGARITGGRDLRSVSIEVEANGCVHKVVFDLPALPREIEPLVAFLRTFSENLLLPTF
jgi:hypothetical protein